MEKRPLIGSFLLVSLVGCQSVTTEENTYQVSTKSHSYLDSKLEKLKELSEQYPRRHDLQYQIAGIHFLKADFNESAVHLKKAIVEKPDVSQYHYHLGRVYLTMGELERAEGSFQMAAQLDHRNRFSGPRAAYAYVLALEKKVPLAIAEFEKCLAIEPDNVLFYYFLGALNDMRGGDPQAVRYFREYLERGGVKYRRKAVDYLESLGVEVSEELRRAPVNRPVEKLPEGIEADAAREAPTKTAPRED